MTGSSSTSRTTTGVCASASSGRRPICPRFARCITAAAPRRKPHGVTQISICCGHAGVAALIWSKNPTFTRDQVAAKLLGTADIQSLADLSNSVNIVRNMRWAPVSTRILIGFAVAALLPMLPLLLLKYPIAELATKLFTGIVDL